MDHSVSSESCKPLDVQTFKLGTILANLGTEERFSNKDGDYKNTKIIMFAKRNNITILKGSNTY